MNMAMKVVVAGILGVMLMAMTPAVGQEIHAAVDPRLEETMDETGLMYRVDDSGNVLLEMGGWGESDRRQLVYINSETETYGNMEVRRVWTRVAIYENIDDISPEELMGLLEATERLKMGRFTAVTLDDGTVLIFLTLVLDAEADADDLISAIELVAIQGDSMESELRGNEDSF
jgi:hypothetical protein